MCCLCGTLHFGAWEAAECTLIWVWSCFGPCSELRSIALALEVRVQEGEADERNERHSRRGES